MMWPAKKPETVEKVVMLPTAQIDANPCQPRKTFDSDAIEQLAASIAANGLLQPILVRPGAHPGRYELIAGERRLRACRALGMEAVPGIVRPVERVDSAVLALVENLQRADLNYFEEAEAIASLLSLSGSSQQAVARMLGRSQPAVANKLRLLRLRPALRRRILEAGLTERHARAVLRLEDSLQATAVEEIVRRQLNVAQTEQYVEKLCQAQAAPSPAPVRPASRRILRDARLLFNSLSKAVNTMKANGFAVETLQTEDEQYVSYVVRIPRDKVYSSCST